VGTYGASSANHIVDEADLVVFAGSGTADMTTANWRLPSEGTAIVQIDIDPMEIGRNYAGTIGIQSDVKAGLEALVAGCAKKPRKAWLEQGKAHVAAWQKVVAEQPGGEHPLRPNVLCQLLTDNLPEDAIFFSDTGWSAQWTGNMIGIRHATQSYYRAAGSLGWSVPAAMGAKAAAPDRPVVVFCGDGGFFYHFPELETARRWGLNVVIVVNNNGGLGQGVRNINATYGNRAGNKEELHRFHPLSLKTIAESLDCWGATVDKASDFAKTFKAALACGKPAVIDVKTDPDAVAPDPWIPSA
jgi:acetolactate synthase-1/2/3 large subunit